MDDGISGYAPIRGFRVQDGPWRAFGEKVLKEPEPAWRSRSAVLRALLEWYTSNPAYMNTVIRDLDDIIGMRQYLGRDNEE